MPAGFSLLGWSTVYVASVRDYSEQKYTIFWGLFGEEEDENKYISPDLF